MSLYTKIELFGFADFYHRFAITGLTMDEMLVNYLKYKDEPRDIHDPLRVPRKLKIELKSPRPPSSLLKKIVEKSCWLNDVLLSLVYSKDQHRPTVQAKQMACYVGIEAGFKPAEFAEILKWDRSQTYQRAKKCIILSDTDKSYCNKLNQLLRTFGFAEYEME